MRANEFITEWREAYLYHATSIPDSIRIWHQDWLRGGTGPIYGRTKFQGVSTTRNYNYALGYLIGNNRDSTGGVIFWINQDLVKRDLGRRRLKGYDWFTDNEPDDTSDEFQRRSEFDDTDRFETVITKGGLHPFKKYVTKIEIWLPKTSDRMPPPEELTPDQKRNWEHNLGDYNLDPKNPDKYRTNIRVDQKVMDRYLSTPAEKQTWLSMTSDPRCEIKQTPGLPRQYQGTYIRQKVQYDTDHPMYGGRR
jgi:hypothetical protein